MIRAALWFPARRSNRKRTSAPANATTTVASKSDLTTPTFDDARDAAPLRFELSCVDVAASERSSRHVAELEGRVTSVAWTEPAAARCADGDARWTCARRSSGTRCSSACERGPVERFTERARGSDAPSPDEAVRASDPFSAMGAARVWNASAPVSSAGVASRAPASFVACEPSSLAREAGSCTTVGGGSAAFDATAGSEAAAGAAGADAAGADGCARVTGAIRGGSSSEGST
jgi:hypothetical protein